MTLDKNFDSELLAKIKTEKICPRARWIFVLRNFLLWFAGILSIVFSALAISVIFSIARFSDMALFKRAGGGFLESILIIMPIFWLIFLVIFIVLVYFNLKKTKNGYRYAPWLIVLSSVLLSCILGCLFYFIGVGEKFDDLLGSRAPFYEQMNPHVRFWSNPQNGRLSGLVLSKIDDNHFLVESIDKEEWNVDGANATFNQSAVIEVGRPMRAMGQVIGERQFAAHEFLPVFVGKEFFKRFGPPAGSGCGKPMACGCGGNRAEKFTDSLGQLFVQNPELKKIFIQDIVDNKADFQTMISRDGRFLLMLNSLDIPSNILNSLK